ncbi:MAG: prepilin-type N-terminal cleavage/methylation domain-containing protein, partial [Acidobacteria bacterium]|nr:prepilin-type N-terminal cleavage/methylation domain-containing protein [Acidobacteriota bacterium]
MKNQKGFSLIELLI